MIASARLSKEVIFDSERSLSPVCEPGDVKNGGDAETYSASNWFGSIRSVSCNRFL